VRIFTKDSLETLVLENTDYTIKWVNEVPDCWLFGYIVKEQGCKNKTINPKSLEERFLPKHPLKPVDYSEKVTIIIPTYNRQDFLIESLESVISQTYPNKEIIVVNDGSTDDTEKVLQKHIGNIIYLKKENGGKSSALNFALSKATGQYIWIFDDDDIALPKKLELQIRMFQENRKLGLIHTSAIYMNEKNSYRVHSGMHLAKYIDKDLLLGEQLKGNHFFSPSVIVRKGYFEQAGKWDERLVRAQDYDMWVRISRYCEVGVLPIPTLHYRIHNGIRGTKAENIGVDEVYQKTKDYDHIIRRKMHKIPIEDIFPNSVNQSDIATQVENYLERALYMAHSDLIEECIDDIESARDIVGNNKYLNLSLRGLNIIAQLDKTITQSRDPKALINILYFVKMIKKANCV
jgi:glycosyltransferase involved in cell wall biosynthesis